MKTSVPPVLIIFSLVCFALVQNTQAVSPPPDGGYPGGNTAEGQNALLGLTTGIYNTAVGYLSLLSNTEGQLNTAIGAGALLADVGSQDAFYGSRNTAIGAAALLSNTTGSDNTANGAFALLNNVSYLNSAFGSNALTSNVIGLRNTAVGSDALFSNTVGDLNTAIGVNALYSNTNGSDNTAVGAGALMGSNGSGNIALGASAGTGISEASGVIAIGSVGGKVSNSCFIGKIRDVTTQYADAIPVVIDSSDQLGTLSSSRRYKQEIRPMDKSSEAILALKPVTFLYKSDKTGRPQFGLIAEDVAKVNPDLVVRDKDGDIYTVRYDAVNAMLLNEFLKEHEKTETLETTVASLIATVKEQAAQIQKVSAQLEASKPTPQVVNNP
jgi:Chaperone of endosialidase